MSQFEREESPIPDVFLIVCQTQKLVERMKVKLAEKGLVSNVVVVDLSSLIRNLEHYLDQLGLEVKKVELRTRNR